MGDILKAECSCGFNVSDLQVGCGIMVKHALLPVACPQCHALWTEDERRRGRNCRKGHVTVYHLHEAGSFTPSDVVIRFKAMFPWNLEGSADDDDVVPGAANPGPIPEVRYRCPLCGKMEMQLVHEGYWD